MWTFIAFAAFSVIIQTYAQQPPSRCVQAFDSGFRKCFKDNGGFELDVIFSLVTNETSGKLPPALAPQKANLIQTLCGNREGITNCIRPLVTNADKSCQQTDIGMMDGTVNSMVSGLGSLCGAPSTQGPSCLQNFDKGIRQCLTSGQINADHFFMLLADQTLPTGVDKAQLKQKSCSDATKKALMQCAKELLGRLQTDCKPQENIMVGTTLQNMMGAYEGVCTGKPVNPDKCMTVFEEGMNTCGQKILNMDMKIVLMVLNGQTLPAGQDAAAIKKSICGKWKDLEMCGKDVVLAAGCARNQILMVEATFANLMITMATFCGDKTLPGACLLTLQKQFGECFGKVGLSPDIYLSNATDHKGALIGANTAETDEYCSKKHDLFTCMQEVIHKCPGAEQTLSLTGFDLHGMERAVGILCHNVPDYLAGLNCFENPTDTAKKCMEDMTTAITDLSTKQLTQKLSMDTFFDDFCSARVNHVSCDGKAWPSCNKSAVDLKNQFECQLIPSRCYNSHKDNIDVTCPNTDMGIPGGNSNSTTALHEAPLCAQSIHQSMNACFQQFGMQPDQFLVNITHERRDYLGDADKAKALCSSKENVFQCMRNVLDTCPEAKNVLSFWGHQQSALENAINIICKELPLYNKGLQCLSNGNAQIQQCISNTEAKMMELTDKQVTKNLSPDAYFRDFCSIRLEHLKCDLNGWKQACDADVLGLKVHFECTLLQDHCKNLQVSNTKQLCNDNTYQSALRGTATGNQQATTKSEQVGNINPKSGATSISGSLISLLGYLVAFGIVFTL